MSPLPERLADHAQAQAGRSWQWKPIAEARLGTG
jgi:hypothetical protein